METRVEGPFEGQDSPSDLLLAVHQICPQGVRFHQELQAPLFPSPRRGEPLAFLVRSHRAERR